MNLKTKSIYKGVATIAIVVSFVIFLMPKFSFSFLSGGLNFSLRASEEYADISNRYISPIYTTSIPQFVKHLPVLVAQFWLDPLPWKIVATKINIYTGLFPGMIVWCLTMPYYIYGIWLLIKNYTKLAFVPYSFVFACVILYPYMLAAPGSRNRVQFVPIVMMASAIGLQHHRRIALLVPLFWVVFVAGVFVYELGMRTTIGILFFPVIALVLLVAAVTYFRGLNYDKRIL